MADISAFPTIVDGVIYNNGPTTTFTATEAVKAGQVVGFAAAGVSNAIVPMDATSGETAIGVALAVAAATEKVGVALVGSIVTVANADDTTAIDAGSYVEQNDNSVKGTVTAAAVAAISGAVGTEHLGIIGIAIEDIAGGGTGKIIIQPLTLTQLNDA